MSGGIVSLCVAISLRICFLLPSSVMDEDEWEAGLQLLVANVLCCTIFENVVRKREFAPKVLSIEIEQHCVYALYSMVYLSPIIIWGPVASSVVVLLIDDDDLGLKGCQLDTTDWRPTLGEGEVEGEVYLTLSTCKVSEILRSLELDRHDCDCDCEHDEDSDRDPLHTLGVRKLMLFLSLINKYTTVMGEADTFVERFKSVMIRSSRGFTGF